MNRPPLSRTVVDTALPAARQAVVAPQHRGGRLFPARSLANALAVLLAMVAIHQVRAAISPETLKSVATNHQDSVLWFSGTVKYHCGRCDQIHQFPIMTTAVVVDAKGIFLAAAAGPLVDPKTEIRDATLHVRTTDGAELPVRIAVTDEELGVIALTLEQPEDARSHPLPPLELESPARVRQLEYLIVLRRHDAGAGYTLSTSTARVNAIETKPRRIYYSGGVTSGQSMSPCFDTTGRLVALATEPETAIASDELADLVAQARKRSTP